MITRGIAFILLATVAFSVMNAVAKELTSFPTMQVVFFRAFGTFIFIFPFLIYKKINIIGNHPKLLFLRGTVGVISLSTFFWALSRMPLGSVISIRYLGPIFGAGLAADFLKEKINSIQWVSFLIAFSGVLVLKGFDTRIDLFSFSLVMISAIFLGFAFVLIRYLSLREHYLVIINYFIMFSMLASLFTISSWRMPVADEWAAVIGIGVLGLIGQVFMTRAFQTEETSVLAPFKYMELLWTLVIGFFWFGESYNWVPFAGIILIAVGMLLNVYGKKKGTVK